MRFIAAIPTLLACAGPLVAGIPTGPGSSADNSAAPANISDIIQQVQTFLNTDDFSLGKLVKRVNDFAAADEAAQVARRSPTNMNVHTIRARIESGDVDLNKAAKDGLAKLSKAARDMDLNALAGESLAQISNKVKENDFNEFVMRGLSNGIESRNDGLRSRVRRGLVSSAMSALVSNISLPDVAKMGMRVMTQIAKNIDFNDLANKGLKMLSQAVENTNVNQVAARSTETLDGLVDKVDLNSVAARGLKLLSE